MIAIIDYGLGNIKAFANVYTRLNIPFKIAAAPAEFQDADRFILPGVGAFDRAMTRLQDSGMRETLAEQVLQKGKPVLGICIGMQMLANASDEGELAGLGWIDGRVRKIDTSGLRHRPHLPHMGWNNMVPVQTDPLLRDVDEDPYFYFLHSYYFDCDHNEDILAETEYGRRFPCAVRRGNVYGVQFHPEKSHHNGINVLKNFASL
ncbi:MAG: imidazole glycerol phosphate synthase subunit HisH [Victivallales bacterium]|nr:imidazole glycerol phosphate synthase subunit HisH [Victivallales bacterium]